MNKSLSENDRIIVNKLSRCRQGDIIIYKTDKHSELNIGRLIARYNDTVCISGQNAYVNGNELLYQGQTKSYVIRFLDENTADSLKNIYKTECLDNSGSYKAELTKTEYDKMMNDSCSDLKDKIVLFEDHIKTFYVSEKDSLCQIVPKDSVFILNDKRSNKFDSRTIGFIATKDIIGKLVLKF